jgi:hypothetical protein
MKSYEVMKQACKRTGSKLVASRLRLSQSLLHKWSRPRPDERSAELNPLDRLVAVTECTGDTRPVEWVCARLGGCFMPNPPVKRSLPRNWLPLTGAVLVELGRLQAALGAAVTEKNLTGPAAATLRTAWDKLKPDMERLVSGCERGQFEPCRNPFCLGRGCTGARAGKKA